MEETTPKAKTWFVKKGEVTPYPDNSRILTANGRTGLLLHKCPCTSTFLHYETLMDDQDYMMIIEHNNIEKIF